MMHYYALFYWFVDDYLERRPAFRAEHLGMAQAAQARGELLLAGAFDPADGALLLWHTEGRAPIEEFVAADPYVRNGLVARWEIRAWTVVIGNAPEA